MEPWVICSRRAGKNRNKSGWVKGLPKETQDEDATNAASRECV